MFGAIKNLANNVKAISEDEVLSRVLDGSEVKTEIAKLNDEQLGEGKYADGAFLPPYSSVSVEKFHKEPGPIKLKDTGDFRASIYVQAAPDSVIVKDSDWKTDMLQNRYGKGILGVKEKLPELRKFIKPMLVKDIKTAIFRK